MSPSSGAFHALLSTPVARKALAGAMALGLCIVPTTDAAVLLSDGFDDGNPATNTTGVGTGFTVIKSLGFDAHAIENAAGLTLFGGATIKNIQSNDPLDPTGTTTTWVITNIPANNPGPNGIGQGVQLGWAREGGPGFLSTQPEGHIVLELRNDRMVFDLQTTRDFEPEGRYVHIQRGSTVEGAVYPGTFVSPVTVSIYLSATTWKIDVTDQAGTISVHQSGFYEANHELNDLLALSGDGKLRALAIAQREYKSATFRSVLISTPAKADLEVTNITTRNNQAAQGAKVTITATVTNSGDGAAGQSTTLFRDGAAVIGSVETPALGAGESVEVPIDWRTATVKGARTLIATADFAETVAESDEENNDAQLTITVQGNQVR